jgi:hypothetical protein
VKVYYTYLGNLFCEVEDGSLFHQVMEEVVGRVRERENSYLQELLKGTRAVKLPKLRGYSSRDILGQLERADV